MKTSARNQYDGSVVKITGGAINDEIEVALDGSGTRITAVITSASVKKLGLEPGRKVVVLIKAPWVILTEESGDVMFSARNQFPGTIVSVEDGAVNAEIALKLDGGESMTAIITEGSTKNLGLAPGSRVTALIKASHVIIGVRR
ncbi:MAG: TOBE domain-containing protein [Synergistaceae bacterium]|nr:TOBE domain-containing protein [Synergistaceae bacterium]